MVHVEGMGEGARAKDVYVEGWEMCGRVEDPRSVRVKCKKGLEMVEEKWKERRLNNLSE